MDFEMETPTFDNNFNEPMLYVIYKISGLGQQYIGMTCDFNDRMNNHKSSVNGDSQTPFYVFIRENGGWNAFSKEILEARIMTRTEALIRETQLIREHNSSLNSTQGSLVPSNPIAPLDREAIMANFGPTPKIKRTKEEQREYKRAYNRYWRKANDEKYKQYLQEWRASHPNYGKEWRAKAKAASATPASNPV